VFITTTLLYPLVLAILCAGAGLLVDRVSGGSAPVALVPVLGVAALIAVSQLSTYVVALAPATPYLLAALAAAGFGARRSELRELAARWRAWAWPVAASVLAFVLALAPVLFSGRATFSSYLTLSDSAFHMQGADYLIHHGQDFSHLDLSSSYGQYMNAYYNTSYPSGADTLFGGSAGLLGLSLMWAYQPFNAFLLAIAVGPAWVLLRSLGLARAWAALGALVASVSALVYAYELIGSIKEVASLPMVLALGALVVSHRGSLRAGARAAIPFALVSAAGVSALGIGFGAWVLAAAAVLLAVTLADLRARRQTLRGVLALASTGVAVLFVGALPTWLDLSGSLSVARGIAATSNPGNLRTPLRPVQVFGVWLVESYKLLPAGAARSATYALAAITFGAAVLGAARVLRGRRFAFAGWLALTLAVWGVFAASTATTWVQAKVLMLTSAPVVVIAWVGLATLWSSRLRLLAPALGVALAGGVIASDAVQYHASNLAPTARFRELASVDSRFSGRGPALFTDFDEYSLYALRNLEVGGPNFEHPPPALDPTRVVGVGAYRYPVVLDRVPPASLLAYPLIVTRRDPSERRPPSAYRLAWYGAYYEVWARSPRAPAALAVAELPAARAHQCARIAALAPLAARAGARLVAAETPALARISLASRRLPHGWGRAGAGVAMRSAGSLTLRFTLPHGGAWELWLQGQVMPKVGVAVDGRRLASVSAQLGGNSVVPNTLTPLRVALRAGPHTLTLTRGRFSIVPGNGGFADVYGAFLTPAGASIDAPLALVAPGRWRELCSRSHEWVEVVA
jgi:hypothetical protein